MTSYIIILNSIGKSGKYRLQWSPLFMRPSFGNGQSGRMRGVSVNDVLIKTLFPEVVVG